MKTLIHAALVITFLLGALAPIALGQAKQPVDYVDPHIGGISHLLKSEPPTVQLPFGMIRLAPVTSPGISDSYLAEKIYGFPWNGAVMMPTVGPVETDPAKNASLYDHDFETATPYYYAVTLEKTDAQVEFSVTERAAYFRITYQQPGDRHIIVRVEDKGMLTADPAQSSVSGFEDTPGARQYLYAQSSRPFTPWGAWEGGKITPGVSTATGKNIGVAVNFADSDASPCDWRVGVSYISVEQARRNVEREIPAWDFAAVKNGARDEWNKALGRIAVSGGSEDEKTIFYTALYRSLWGMADITEDGRYYSGYDKQVHSTDGHDFYVDDSLWDTYRSEHPLELLLSPSRQLDMVSSYIRMYEQSGWMPRDPTVGGPGEWMIGNHSASLIADTYAKGYTDFDAEKAYEGIRKNATQGTVLPWRLGPLTPLDRIYQERGYLPALAKGEAETSPDVHRYERRQAASVTLENSYDDWCVAQMAKALHKDADYEYFLKRAHDYQKVYNPEIGFMAPRTADGKWVEGFDPKLGGGQGGRDYFTEVDGWVYSFHVQHDVAGLIQLMGGREKFAQRLDALFEEPFGTSKFSFLAQFPDATGSMGLDPQGDEPGFHIPYLYNYAGEPWMTQRRVREMMKIWYTSGLMGIPGDEDWGATSSWYVFSAVGFYPVCPGSPTYNIGSPIFNEAKITLENGRTFTIRAVNQSAHNKYIQSATLNGRPLDKPWFSHSDIAEGGTLVLELGPRPNKSWGSAPDAAPPSMSQP
ncbi:MAG: GH92 family glycosyl hydrolase [Terriglobia bacterium]